MEQHTGASADPSIPIGFITKKLKEMRSKKENEVDERGKGGESARKRGKWQRV